MSSMFVVQLYGLWEVSPLEDEDNDLYTCAFKDAWHNTILLALKDRFFPRRQMA